MKLLNHIKTSEASLPMLDAENNIKEETKMKESLENAIIGVMKAQAVVNAIDEVYTQEWRKIGPAGKFAVSLLLTLRDIIDDIDNDLDHFVSEEE